MDNLLKTEPEVTCDLGKNTHGKRAQKPYN